MDFLNEMEQRRVTLETMISSYLPKEEGYQKVIMEAMKYSVEAGGKRIRPMLIHECYQLFGGQNKDVVAPFVAAMEMIHTYSLVHDDLPAMDDDEYRRGRKTTHIVYGEAMGIPAGDALLNYAFETAMLAFDVTGQEVNVSKALRVLAKEAGIYGMIGGQVVDVAATNQTIEKEKLDFIYELKTGALIEASMMIGAILAGASQSDVAVMEKIAYNIGLAFQVQDDILDVTSTTEVLGKPVFSDDKNNKTTYVALVGLTKAQNLVAMYTKEALDLLQDIDGNKAYLSELLNYLISREK